MAIKPVTPLSLSDVEMVQLSLAPKLPDGSVDPGPFAWTSNDPSIAQVVGINPDGTPNSAETAPTGPVVWVLTPAGPGAATITATSASLNVDGDSIAITITEGMAGDVNLSAGTPVSDLVTSGYPATPVTPATLAAATKLVADTAAAATVAAQAAAQAAGTPNAASTATAAAVAARAAAAAATKLGMMHSFPRK